MLQRDWISLYIIVALVLALHAHHHAHQVVSVGKQIYHIAQVAHTEMLPSQQSTTILT